MRQGELLGLQWKNVDLEKGIIKVNQNLKKIAQWQSSIWEAKNKNIYQVNHDRGRNNKGIEGSEKLR